MPPCLGRLAVLSLPLSMRLSSLSTPSAWRICVSSAIIFFLPAKLTVRRNTLVHRFCSLTVRLVASLSTWIYSSWEMTDWFLQAWACHFLAAPVRLPARLASLSFAPLLLFCVSLNSASGSASSCVDGILHSTFGQAFYIFSQGSSRL